MQQEHERFKLDAAAILPVLFRQQQRIIVYNFNIPIQLAQNSAILETVQSIIERDFPLDAAGVIRPPYFQLTAVYTIEHQGTTEERLWVGSFNPRARDLSQVTAFRPFEAESFVNYCVLNSEPERVRNKLTSVVSGRKSLWALKTILSIIVTAQTTVSLDHPIFVQHPTLAHIAQQRHKNVFRVYLD